MPQPTQNKQTNQYQTHQPRPQSCRAADLPATMPVNPPHAQSPRCTFPPAVAQHETLAYETKHAPATTSITRRGPNWPASDEDSGFRKRLQTPGDAILSKNPRFLDFPGNVFFSWSPGRPVLQPSSGYREATEFSRGMNPSMIPNDCL